MGIYEITYSLYHSREVKYTNRTITHWYTYSRQMHSTQFSVKLLYSVTLTACGACNSKPVFREAKSARGANANVSRGC